MRLTLNELRSAIRDVLTEMTAGRKRRLDFNNPRSKFDPQMYDEEDVLRATHDLFQGVASDLGIDDPSADAFIDYFGMVAIDAGVPVDMIQRIKAKLVGR